MKRKIILGLALIFIVSTVQAFEGGSGTSGDPYQIANCQQLQNMSNGLSAHYEIIENIDCSDTQNWNGGNGFKPIGNSTESFRGSLTGNYNFIQNLYIERPSRDNTGLIGFLNSGEISQVRIRGGYVSGNQNTGGLLGNEDGGGQIINSSFQGEVYGAYRTGGLAGTVSQGSIIDSYSAGYVDNSGGADAGGLLGALYGNEVRNSYSTAIVDSGSYTGGLIGALSGTVINSYSAGEIINEDRGNTGGLVGAFFTGSSSTTYWDVNQSSTNNSAVGEGLTTSEMIDTAGSNMNFDFLGPGNTWTTNDFYYPKLEWQQNGVNGDNDDPYLIENCHQLQFMNQSMTSTYQLSNSIDCSLTEEWNNGKGFYPIGGENVSFDGKLDGDSNLIEDLYINRPNRDNFVGLFGRTRTDNPEPYIVQDTGMISPDVTGGFWQVAAFIGQNQKNSVAVRDSFVKDGRIEGSYRVGSIIGQNFGGITRTYSDANITNSYGGDTGGLVGTDSVSGVRNSYFAGRIQATDGNNVNPITGTEIDVNATDSYWDNQTVRVTNNEDNGGEGLQTYEMTGRRAVEYMEGFNFTDTWVARDNDRYPELAVFTNESGFSPGVDQPPGLPTLLSPDDGQQTLPIDPNLTAELYHPQSESMTVDFVRPNGSSIGSDSGGSLDSVNSVWEGRDSGTSYNWSLVIEDSTGQTLNVTEWVDDWRFTTIYAPDRPGTPDPSDGAAGVEVDSNLTAFTSQNDGLNLFSDLYLTNNSSDARSEFDLEASSSVSGSGDAEFNPAALDNSTDYRWFVNSTVTDRNGNILWNASPTWDFRSYETPEPDEIMPVDGETGLEPQPQLNVSVNHSENLTVEFYDFQSNTLLGTERIENGNWANISTDSFNEYSKSQTHYWYVDITTDSGETWDNNDSQAYSFTVSNVEDVKFDEKTENDINLDPGTADVGQEELRAEVSTPNGVTMEEIAFNISNSMDYEVTGNNYDVASGETVTANLSEASIVQEDGSYEWYAFYREGSNVLFNSSERTFSTYVAQLDWVPTSGNYDGGDRETINIYYNESSTGFENFDYSGSVDYEKIKDTDSLTVANPKVDSGDQACYQLTVENLLGESSPEGDCIGGVP